MRISCRRKGSKGKIKSGSEGNEHIKTSQLKLILGDQNGNHHHHSLLHKRKTPKRVPNSNPTKPNRHKSTTFTEKVLSRHQKRENRKTPGRGASRIYSFSKKGEMSRKN